WPFSVLFVLLSLLYASKAASAATKIPQKFLAGRCDAVVTERIFVQASKITQGILSYLKRIFRSMGGNTPVKTGVGSTLLALR
ncbi:MAG: hypothetical protein N2Z65_05710, partial [Clostridiales bacterium]|nr:hypothetical protein [Clostridiales bacterium]